MNKKISVVTGASSGLGFAIAKKLVELGENVCIIGRNEGRLTDSKKSLLGLSKGSKVELRNFDVSDEDKVIECFTSLKEAGYIVDKLFNVAGLGIFGGPTTVTKEKLIRTLDANLIGLILMSTEALKSMSESGGKIINVMSTAGKQGKANESMYCASKWGARGYTESLKAAYKGTNISIIGVYPGGMNTAFWNGEASTSADVETFMNPDEVAEQIVFAVANENKLNVSEIVIDRK